MTGALPTNLHLQLLRVARVSLAPVLRYCRSVSLSYRHVAGVLSRANEVGAQGGGFLERRQCCALVRGLTWLSRRLAASAEPKVVTTSQSHHVGGP